MVNLETFPKTMGVSESFYMIMNAIPSHPTLIAMRMIVVATIFRRVFGWATRVAHMLPIFAPTKAPTARGMAIRRGNWAVGR